MVLLILFEVKSELSTPIIYPAGHEYSGNFNSTERDENNQKKEKKTVWENLASDPVALSTLCLTAVTAVLALSTSGLWWATRRGIDTQISDTRILQRAYISVEPGGIKPFDYAADDRVACDIVITNAGNLPARSLSWFIDKKYSRDAHETDFPITRKLVGDIVLVPRASARKGADPTSVGSIRQNTRGKGPYEAWLYVWGRVSYHDGFRGGRFVDFCHRYNLYGARDFMITAESARYHEHGNRTDEG